jgi:hypothetical protein
MLKLLYKPLGMLVSVLGGVLASRLFAKAWKVLGHQNAAPSSTDARRGWGEILMAAGLQGAIFGLVKAAVDRGAATGFKRATGAWPGPE